ncbi:MAG: UDP-N-acetylmuramoyl-tripeptide--D-alanyl-D-alanine ligase [Syntrophomonas sp.]|nr:UDP-N-acetylmuramoyl-tripeptide--D-alanyl-D-alanine ligase [Syntrophomonas sp.]
MQTLVLKRPVIAVAGSSGKTTTKEMIASILKRQWKIYKSIANRNNRQHLSHHAKQIRPFHRAVVLEYGMSAPGHLRRSCKIIKPNMAVITMIGTAHIGNMGGSVKKLIKAKSELIANMKQSGTLFLNNDDIQSKGLNTKKFTGKIVTVGIKNAADYHAYNLRTGQQGMFFEINLAGNSQELYIPILGIHNVYNALLAVAVSDCLGFSSEQIREGLKKYKKLHGRLRVFNLKNNVCLIDDTFNANPNSVKTAIDVLGQKGAGKNIAILGSMSELGSYSQRGHKQVGRYLADKNVDYLYTYGRGAKIIGKAAIAHGFPAVKVMHSSQRQVLHKKIKKNIERGATILVKGSHNIMMNKTVKFIKNAK